MAASQTILDRCCARVSYPMQTSKPELSGRSTPEPKVGPAHLGMTIPVVGRHSARNFSI